MMAGSMLRMPARTRWWEWMPPGLFADASKIRMDLRSLNESIRIQYPSGPFLEPMPSVRSKKSLPPVTDEALALIAAWFRTLAEPSRLKILRALEAGGELNISELVEATGLTQANVSRHVQSLVDAGMVGRRKEGLSVICFIADPSITELCDKVCGNLLKRLSQQVEKLGGV